jgi:hypothetical protein
MEDAENGPLCLSEGSEYRGSGLVSRKKVADRDLPRRSMSCGGGMLGRATGSGLSLEERVAVLEATSAPLTRERQGAGKLPGLWWEQRFGACAESPEYAEARRLGRAYRESLRAPDQADEAL